MSFQRMLMIATRESRPYLPHPEALVCLYVPRWQSEHGDVLYDLSGNDYHLTRTAGTVRWQEDGSVTVSSTGAMAYRGETQAVNEHTILADRQGWRRDSGGVNILANCNGFKTRRDSTSINVVETSRTGNQIHTYSNGRNNTVTQYANESRSWVIRRRNDYCGHTINYNNESNTPNRIVLGGSYGSSGSLWMRTWCVAMWSISLTDEEIEMAKLFLSTASLEDYMRSRL